MHNAPFDSSFINKELELLGYKDRLQDLCQITDSLSIAREKHPGQRNSLDALINRYEVDGSSRDVHGALIDAKLLARVYLLMTGGQVGFFLKRMKSLIILILQPRGLITQKEKSSMHHQAPIKKKRIHPISRSFQRQQIKSLIGDFF